MPGTCLQESVFLPDSRYRSRKGKDTRASSQTAKKAERDLQKSVAQQKWRPGHRTQDEGARRRVCTIGEGLVSLRKPRDAQKWKATSKRATPERKKAEQMFVMAGREPRNPTSASERDWGCRGGPCRRKHRRLS